MSRLIDYIVRKVFLPRPIKLGAKAPQLPSDLGTPARLYVPRCGKELACIVLEPELSEPEGTAVLGHSFHKGAKSTFLTRMRPITEQYLGAGFRVVLFDFNGFGESPPIDLYFYRDIQAVLDWVASSHVSRPLIVHGLSFAAFHMIPTLETLPPNSGAVFECSIRSVEDLAQNGAPTRLHRWLGQAILAVARATHYPPYEAMNMRRILSQLGRPDLKAVCITCEQDTFSPPDQMRDLFRQWKRELPVERFATAQHLRASTDEPERYRSLLADVLSEVSGSQEREARV